MKALLITDNMEFKTVELPERKYMFQRMAAAIGCERVEFTNPKRLKDEFCMVCDESALLKENPRLNLIATYLCKMDGNTEGIFGNVLIMADKSTPDGIETIGLTERELETVKIMILMYGVGIVYFGYKLMGIDPDLYEE